MEVNICNIKKIIDETIEEFSLRDEVASTWRKPLLAVASADDDYFIKLKEIISFEHRLPEELLPDAKSVITYFLPFTEDIPASNAGGSQASKKWAQAYIETNRLIDLVNQKIGGFILDAGYDYAAPAATDNFSEEELISFWSHKHVAWIAGLGKFGLHKMLITRLGSAGRIGSIVVDVKLDVTSRSKEELCLFYQNGSCKKCIDSCVFGALTENVFNRDLCYEVCKENARIYGGGADVCGKCTADVPCAIFQGNVGLKQV